MKPKTIEAVIINRGRGPEIAGTRITIYDVMDYYKHGWYRDRIAALFRLSSRDIQAAIDYIEAHSDKVMADYERILARHHTYQYAPEVQTIVDTCRKRAQKRLDEVRQRRSEEAQHAEDHG